MRETTIRNNSEFRVNREAESDFMKIFEDFSEEELFPVTTHFTEQDLHKLLI